MEKITVLYYHYDNSFEDPQEDLFAPGEIAEQQITCVFEETEEIGQLLKALYPGELLNVAGGEIMSAGEDYRFDVRISLTSEALKEGYRETNVYLIRDREPEFLEKAVREAAVRG